MGVSLDSTVVTLDSTLVTLDSTTPMTSGTSVVFSPALQAPITLSNPTGSLTLASTPVSVAAQANPIPVQGSISAVGAAVRMALGMLISPGALLAATAAATVISGLVNLRATTSGPLVATGVSPTLSISSSGSTVTGFLPAGNWVAAKMPLAVVQPRPDNETGGTFTSGQTIYSRHRYAFYDGVNPVQYEFDVAIQGGARPLVYQLIAGPSWMSIGSAYGQPYYGVLHGTPNAAISPSSPVTVTIRVFGQDLASTDVSYTLATSTNFLFVDSAAGSDSNPGTFGSRFQTLAKVMGTNSASTTFPGAFIYMSGSLQWPTQAGATAGYFNMDRTKVPIVYMTLPGVATTIDATLVQIIDQGGGCSDMYWGGSSSSPGSRIAIVGSSGPAAETHTFELYNPIRCCWRNVDFQNPINRTAPNGNTNSTTIFTSNSGIIKQYYTVRNCTETGRSGSANNSMLLTSLFSVQNSLFEFNTVSGTAGFGVFFKDSNRYITAAHNSVTLLGGNGASPMMFGCQTNNLGTPPAYPGFCEACYNYLVGGPLFFDFQGFGGSLQHWSYRNTILNNQFNYNYGLGNFGPTGTGPYFTDSDVVIAKTPGGAIAGASVPFTIANNEAWLVWSGSPPTGAASPIDANGNLQNIAGGIQYRSLYAFKRGWEIGGFITPAPTNVQVVLQALDTASTAFSLPVQPTHQTVAWTAVSGATSYNIYAQDYSAGAVSNTITTPYRVIATITAAQAATAYSSYVSSNSSGGFSSVGIVNCAYHDTTCPSVVNPTKGTGPIYNLTNGRTYQISAVVNSVEGTLSTDNYIPFFAGGKQIMCQGTFNGTISFAGDALALSTSPLGYTTNATWSPVNPGDLINPFTGIGCYGQLLSIVGMNYMIINVLANTNGTSFTMGPEITGDQSLLNAGVPSANYGTLTAGNWVSIKVPLSTLYIDQKGGTNALQDAFYKVTLVASGGTKWWMEWYFSRN